ncbi:MAG: protoheme IX farnesyltransferase [Candidatus Tectimicrobiota bacterium]|nr:MAG: protoheme IX farnesyltransferase [Candidatus Tectomicrobia bacterium]
MMPMASLSTVRVAAWQRLSDYVALTKPRLLTMVLAVTAVGFYMGTVGGAAWGRMAHLLVGIALAAGGSLALNQYLERETDALMPRTQSRPLPDGRLQPLPALCFGLALTMAGLGYLAVVVGPLPALVTALTTATYLCWYTPLKLKTPLCSLVGAIPGALPPVAGWVAARGSLGRGALVLFAILFLWQLPHALAIAWLYRDEFARAGVRLLPVVHPDGHSTGRQVVTNCLALLAVGSLPTLMGLSGRLYFVVAFLLGLMFLGCGVHLAWTRTTAAARRLLFASLLYLPLVYLVMALDKVGP